MDLGTIFGVASLVIGVPALVMAVSPFTQMLWGRPKLRFEFTDFTGHTGKNLICNIHNDPVTNWFHKIVGVSRDAGELYAFISIIEQGTNRIVPNALNIPAIINDPIAGTLGRVAKCRPNYPVQFTIINCTTEGPKILDPRNKYFIPVPNGHFVIEILIECGDRPYLHRKLVAIDSDPIRTNWLEK
jgi:hypothetical protein